MKGLTQAELLDLFDRCEPYPQMRRAIRAVLRPEEPEGRTITLPDLSRVLQDWMPDGADLSLGLNGDSIHLVGSDLARFLLDRDAEYAERAS